MSFAPAGIESSNITRFSFSSSFTLYFVTTIQILALIKRASAATCFFDLQMLFYLFGDGGGIAV